MSRYKLEIFEDFYDGPLNGFVRCDDGDQFAFFVAVWSSPDYALHVFQIWPATKQDMAAEVSNPFICHLLRSRSDLGGEGAPLLFDKVGTVEQFDQAMEFFKRTSATVEYKFGRGVDGKWE
jgi:deoxyribodipyrimidine photolyase